MLCVLRYQGSNQGEVTVQDEHQEHVDNVPSPEGRNYRPTTTQAEQPAYYRPTTGPPFVIEQSKVGVAPVVPVSAKRREQPPRPPEQPLSLRRTPLEPVPGLPAELPPPPDRYYCPA